MPAVTIRSSPSRRPWATPSSTARVRCLRSWPTVSPMNPPRASGSGCGLRSPPRYGRNESPSAPAETVAASASRSAHGTPGAIASRYQRRLPAADSITDIRCQRSGTAWQKAWTLPAGSKAGRSVAAKMTPDVPSESATTPGSTAPTPTALAAWSPPPATTGVPGRRPVAAAASSEIAPVTVGPSWAAGMSAGSSSSAFSTSPDQSRAARSNSSVPAPSARSVARSPVSRRRT